ncbi:hypothetical protein HAZT_HAZT002374 [Hyalella azteca]|uniref:Zinc transporter ZIP9 n=1 Tax=Hyalella azteca TaxID=294128 RepID=A0A6A0H508_HYAAZ|nr:zinc transporter ZIP9 [Hyalella azteca]KAA0197982.1 hypothetical protein HAZT_HAZT002374 [Hyalella azteca]
MEPFLELTMMSIAMFLGCYISGRLPLWIQGREGKSQELMSVFGAGLLVGTAFTVIIPEGIRTLYISCLEEDMVSSKTPSAAAARKELEPVNEVVAAPAHEHQHHRDNEMIVALSLLLGFLFMLFVDMLSTSSHFHSPRGDLDSNPSSGVLLMQSSNKTRRVCTATLGLVVHAAADGIALGAAVASHHSDVEFIVFFAIMLHKAPTAFGLTSYLVKEGNDLRRINKLLLVFSFAAPVGAFITYTLVTMLGSPSMSDSANTSIAMLFSAGTFLYVATVHILPDITNSSTADPDAPKHVTCKQFIFLIIGAFVPLLFSLGHHH